MATYSIGGPQNYQNGLSTDNPVIRPRVFTQIDNFVTQNTSLPFEKLRQDQSNEARVEEIKKKYDKLTQKSTLTRESDTFGNIHNAENMQRPRSSTISADNPSAYTKQAAGRNIQPSYSAYKDRKPIIEKEILSKKDGEKRLEYSNYKNDDLKKQLQSNREAISKMKSELQAKLSNLSMATNSMKSNPQAIEVKADFQFQNKKKFMVDSPVTKYIPGTYEAKGIQAIRSDKNDRLLLEVKNGRGVESKAKPQTTNYRKKYLEEYSRAKVDQKKELSRITQISNSNNSQTVSDFNQNELSMKMKLLLAQKRKDQSYSVHSHKNSSEDMCAIDGKYSQITTNYKQPQNKIFFKETPKQSTQKWFKNTNSYLYENKIQNLPKEQFTFKKGEVSISKIDNNISGVMIKRTTTEQTFMNIGKTNLNLIDQKILTQNTDFSKSLHKTPTFADKSIYLSKNNLQNDKVSKQIQKIQNKIKEFERNKKEMNIDFKPYEQQKPSAKITGTPKKYIVDDDGQISFTQDRDRRQSYLERVKPIYSDITLPSKSYQLQDRDKVNVFAFKLLPVQNDQQPTYSNSHYKRANNKQEYLDKLEMEKRTDFGIQERKKKLQQKVQSFEITKKLVKALCSQATIDQNLRNAKVWFASYSKKNKWQELKSELKYHKIHMSQNEIKEEFTATQAQNNPFFSVTQAKGDVSTLISAYVASKKSWDESIAKQFKRQHLQRQGFTASKFDLDKKGFILIEDFVRFLNIQSGTFLRNRDIALIFRRIAKSTDKITFDQFLHVILQK